MNTDKLAKVYLDDQPLDLAEAQPQVSSILFASGKPASSRVQWLKSRSDPKGKTMLPEEVVDRTAEPNAPIYLTSVDAGSFGRIAKGEQAEGKGAPESQGEPMVDRNEPAGKSDTEPGQVAQKDAAKDEPAKEKQPFTEADRGDDAAAGKDD